MRAQGITDEQLKTGYRCDPTSKSNLKIIAKKVILIRLTRNLDKSQGFVNGAIATVFENLGDGVFVAQLLETGNMVFGLWAKTHTKEAMANAKAYARRLGS